MATQRKASVRRRHTWSFSQRWDVLAPLVVWLGAFVIWWVAATPEVNTSGLTPIGVHYFHPDYDVVIYVASGVVAVVVSAFFSLKRQSPQVAETVPNPPPNTFNKWNSLADLLAILLIISLVVVISPEELAERAFAIDGFHHMDFYVLGPLQAYRYGAALGTDVYTQYGSGWVLTLMACSHFLPVTPQMPFILFPIFGALYFVSIYVFLRRITKNVIWSWVGLLACLEWQMFSGTDVPLWVTPSSTVLRMPFDMLIATALLKRSTAPRSVAVAVGALGGLSVIFGTDTGVYITIALMIYSIWLVVNLKSRHQWSFVIWLWPCFLVTALAGLWLASRNTIWESRFWTGYFESILEYGGGFGALPIGSLIDRPVFDVIFMTILLTYTLSLATTCARVIRGTASDQDLVLGTIAIIGFGTLMLFINRSHPFNLFHPIVPCCVLATITLFQRATTIHSPNLSNASVMSYRKPLAICAVLIFLLTANPHLWDCPTLVAATARSVFGGTSESKLHGLADLTEQSRYVNRLVSKLKDMGHHIDVVGEDPTIWLMEFDQRPVGRYCPSVLINQKQVERMRAAIEEKPPEVLLVAHRPATNKMILVYWGDKWKLVARDNDYSIYARPDFHGWEAATSKESEATHSGSKQDASLPRSKPSAVEAPVP